MQAITEIMEEYDKVHIPKENYKVPSKDVKMNKDGTLSFNSMEGSYTLTDHSFQQLVEKVRTLAGLSASSMPVKYFKACPSHSRAYQINDWINHYKDDKEWLFRAEPNGRIKAVLSDNYSIMDNQELLNTIYETQGGDIKFTDVWMNTDSLHLRYTDEQTRKGFDKTATLAGYHISNGEIGNSSVNVGFLVYQLICSNGLMGIKEDPIFRKRHVGDMDISYDFAAALEDFNITEAEEIVEGFVATNDVEIEDNPEHVFRAIQQNYPQITNNVVDLAKENVENYEGRLTKFSLISSITESIRDLYSTDDRYKMEKVAGRLYKNNRLTLREGEETKIIKLGA